MPTRRDPISLRLCLALLRMCAAMVPRAMRAEWRAEWDAEIRHRWTTLERRDGLTFAARLNLFRRALGALPDAAWLRRQFTLDADAVHDIRHGVRMLRTSPAFTLVAIAILTATRRPIGCARSSRRRWRGSGRSPV